MQREYIRHGTQCLIANLEVATGQLIAPSIGATRTEADFLAHIQQTVATDPTGTWVLITDQLNTHQSESLVKWVAQVCGIKTDLGLKGEEGILESMATRAAFLQAPTRSREPQQNGQAVFRGYLFASWGVDMTACPFCRVFLYPIPFGSSTLPLHTSWLNQIELWFSILVRRLLKRSSFTSVDDLRDRILAFINYFNQTLALPFVWTYKGRPLVV